jgi:predicted DNA binding protein/transcriptional regulator with GAF, ATPase, and Fis domain
LVTAEGNERWVQTTGVPIYEDDELVKLRGALQDITERKERELALESLQETAQRLLGTETESDVADLVVDSAAEFLDTSCLALYLLDNETNHLEPVAYSPTFAQRCGNMEAVSIEQDNSILWDAFVNGERITVDAEMADESPVFEPAIEGGLVVPIADYGVFVVSTPDPPVDNETERLVETLVATTEAALDRLESETLLRERESELATRNQRLRRQMQVNDIIRSTHTSLIGADSRTEIEETVCERLVEAEHVRFAWLGGFDAGDTEMEVRAWAGTGQDYLDDLPLAVDGGNEPSLVTARTGEPTVVENVIDDLDTAQWRQDALLREFHSVVSVPLSFDEFSVGILTVYADEPNAFGDLEETVFTELGESIAHSIVGVNTRQALHAETLVELTVQLTSDSFFTRIARDGDCQVQYEGLASYSGQGSRLFFTTVGAEAETVLDVLADLVSVTDARLVSTFEDECLFEVTVTDETIPVRLARHGGRLRSVQVVDDVLELVVDVPRTTDVREFLDMLEEEYASVELLGRRDVERSIQTRQEFLDYLLEELTDRQREVLRTAYYAGFFEWPRASTGEDIAEMLGVTQPTVNRHLRLGQQRLLEALFEHPVSDRD